MSFMNQLSEPGNDPIKLGKGLPKKVLKEREKKKQLEKEMEEAQLRQATNTEATS